MINSKAKGKRSELRWASKVTDLGYPSKRGCQNAGRDKGGDEQPDVVTPSLPQFHWEVKSGKRINLWDALSQCGRDKKPEQFGIVAAKKDFCDWVICLTVEDFFSMVNGDHLDMMPFESRAKIRSFTRQEMLDAPSHLLAAVRAELEARENPRSDMNEEPEEQT